MEKKSKKCVSAVMPSVALLCLHCLNSCLYPASLLVSQRLDESTFAFSFFLRQLYTAGHQVNVRVDKKFPVLKAISDRIFSQHLKVIFCFIQ
jgi:hypothetical protein